MGIFDQLFSSDPREAAYMALAAGLLSGKGRLGPIVGNSLMNASQVYQDTQAAGQKARMNDLQYKALSTQLQDQEEQKKLDDQFRSSIQSPQAAAALQMMQADQPMQVDPSASLLFQALQKRQIKPMEYVAATQKSTTPIKLGAGETLLDPSNYKPVASNPKEEATPEKWRLYLLSGAPQRGVGFDEWNRANLKSGAMTNTTILPKIELKTGESLAGQVGPMLKESREKAVSGLRLVDSANRILDAAEAGNLYAGPMANQKLKLAQIADTLGIAGKDTAEKITNTRAVIRGMAEQAVAARSQLGGQAQISNSEQELLNKATSGDIAEMTNGEIIQIAQLNDRLGRQLYGSHSEQLKNMEGDDNLKSLGKFYGVPELPGPRPKKPSVDDLVNKYRSGKPR